MEIKIIQGTYSDGAMHDELYINDKRACSAYPLYECPEDASLERSMISCNDVEGYMLVAYKAGKAGEPYDCVYEDEDEK